MLRRILFFCMFGCSLFLSNCRAKPVKKSNYIDFVIKDSLIVLLTDSGKINMFYIKSGKSIDSDINNSAIVNAITLTKSHDIFVATTGRKIERFDPETRQFTAINKARSDIWNVIYNSSDKGFALTINGIEDLSSKKTYKPDISLRLNKQIGGWGKPSAIFMDKDDKLWIGFGHGEWGGNLFVFDTKTNKFIKPVLNGFKIDLEPVKSIFSDGNSIYLSCGLEHMLTFGCIVKIANGRFINVFNSESTWKTYSEKGKILQKRQPGEYIGPATYNNLDSCFYFYSQTGLYRGKINGDLSQIANWTKIASPALHWRNGQPDAVGSPMNVLKMQFDDEGNLYLLTQNDGIGRYDGKDFKLLN
ncbi:hypothetical protein [Mucilaginibacter agri]|uniref:Two component regulator propeller n=1 Tax=Mucilaginibacter agri TaxID=2695265 RepID=A0A965ZIB6_9SPHI|nr:hypothetical protein [Mucilaginibacter agri]NCD71628.1 hypothetical protein [Mucilaginibacter agri]